MVMKDSNPVSQTTKSVPVDPTDSMLWAGYQADCGIETAFEDFMLLSPGWREDIRKIWRAMVLEA